MIRTQTALEQGETEVLQTSIKHLLLAGKFPHLRTIEETTINREAVVNHSATTMSSKDRNSILHREILVVDRVTTIIIIETITTIAEVPQITIEVSIELFSLFPRARIIYGVSVCQT